MALNGLVAKPVKTTLLLMNKKKEEALRVGEVLIQQEKTSKELGINIDDDLGWKNHAYGKGGLISSLDQREQLTRRLRNYIGVEKSWKIVDSLRTSKLHMGYSYGRQ